MQFKTAVTWPCSWIRPVSAFCRVIIAVWLCSSAAQASFAGLGGAARRHQLSSRRFVLEDMQPLPYARGVCRLAWYTAPPPAFGDSSVRCSGGSGDACLQPCSSGFDRVAGTSVCVQRCPDAAAGPHHLCPISRTCVREDGICPMGADVPHLCTAQDAFLGSCAKQSYQAVLAVRNVGVECSDGLTFKDYTGGWRCAPPPELSACAPGFSNNTGSRAGIGMHCRQECPPWLVDCGDSCHMPGVHCSTAPQHLCPVVPLEACSMATRASTALQTACAAEGFRGAAACPMTLTMHGGCGGAQLQVAAGLRSRGFLSKLEAWWGAPKAAGQAAAASADGPITALRLTFTNDKEPVVFGNASLTYALSPQSSFTLEPSELITSSRLWTSLAVMDGTRLSPVLGGFSLFTSIRRSLLVGKDTGWAAAAAAGAADPRAGPVGAARMHYRPLVALSGDKEGLGTGLPVGAAAYTSSGGIHAFGLLFLSKVAKQEL